MSSTRRFLGESSDERRARRRAALIDAVLDQVTESGLQATSVRSICSRAGLISRYFYESFANLDELLSAALDATAEEIITTGMEAMAGLDEADRRHRLVVGLDGALGVLLDDPRKGALMAAMGAGDAALQRKRREIVVAVANGVRADPAAASFTEESASSVSMFVAGGLVETTLAFIDGELGITRAQLVEQLVDIVIGIADATAAVRSHD